ncbi:hypothetical protein NHQ30_010599 [Ciborinia camelliae]|nr:hypothetical protein NHQ30_010599 [Ciborinia camelliae]
MVFDLGIGQIITLTQLAWDVIQNSKRAGDVYLQITTDLENLHGVLDSLRNQAKHPKSLLNQENNKELQRRLNTTITKCEDMLENINKPLSKYNGLSKDKRKVRKLGLKIMYGNTDMKDVPEIRQRITFYTSSISAFLGMLSVNSLGGVENSLRVVKKDMRNCMGEMEGFRKEFRLFADLQKQNRVREKQDEGGKKQGEGRERQNRVRKKEDGGKEKQSGGRPDGGRPDGGRSDGGRPDGGRSDGGRSDGGRDKRDKGDKRGALKFPKLQDDESQRLLRRVTLLPGNSGKKGRHRDPPPPMYDLFPGRNDPFNLRRVNADIHNRPRQDREGSRKHLDSIQHLGNKSQSIKRQPWAIIHNSHSDSESTVEVLEEGETTCYELSDEFSLPEDSDDGSSDDSEDDSEDDSGEESRFSRIMRPLYRKGWLRNTTTGGFKGIV